VSPVHPRRLLTIYPGWWLALGASLSLGVVAGTTFWAFGLLAGPLEAEFGWSRATIAAAASLTLLISGCASPVVGRLVDRYQPRAVIAVGSVMTALAFVLLSRVTELWHFLALLVLLSFFRTWIFYVPFTTLVTTWFARRRATAMGIATSGFGLGGLLVMPAMGEVISALGWRESFLAAAALVLLVNGAFVLLARNRPPLRWLDHESRSPAAPSAPPAEGLYSTDGKSPFGTFVFWLMAAGFALFFFAQWAFLFHGPQFFTHAGLAPREAALLFGASAGLGVFLRLASGALIDRVVRIELLAAGVLCSMAAAVLLLTVGLGAPLLAAFVLLWGVGSGIGPALEPLLVSRVFGRKQYATVYGAMDGVDTVVSIPGPWIGGLLLDTTGSYAPVLVLYGAVFLIGAASFGWLARIASRGAAVPRPAPLQTPVLAR
jgi:sugar phosphate permease